jgi:hypothetical protein
MELYPAGTRGLKRDLIIELETSRLTSETGEIIRYRAINRWDQEDEFDEWARPLVTMIPYAEYVVRVTNEQLAGSRPSEVVLADFLAFLHG